MSQLVSVSISDHVAEVRLNRPDKMNALNPADHQRWNGGRSSQIVMYPVMIAVVIPISLKKVATR